MSCRRFRRELVELVRFGALDRRHAPHIEHLAGCRDCLEEVGLDRALVMRLRDALAERVAGAAPSPALWPVILARAQAPERGFGVWLRGWASGAIGRLRTATAISAMAVGILLLGRVDIDVSSAPAPQFDVPTWNAAQALARHDVRYGRPSIAVADIAPNRVLILDDSGWVPPGPTTTSRVHPPVADADTIFWGAIDPGEAGAEGDAEAPAPDDWTEETAAPTQEPV
jgi:hypothetical protein